MIELKYRESNRKPFDPCKFRCSPELQNLLMLLKSQLPNDEFQVHVKKIATVLAEMGQALTQPALNAYPTLDREVEASPLKCCEFI